MRLNQIIIGLLCLATAVIGQTEVIELDRIVAVVNKDVITKQELSKAFNVVVKNFQRKNIDIPPANILTKQVLDKLIMEKVQLDLAERSGIRSDETTLNRAIVRIAGQNGLSLSEFINTIAEEGIDYKEFRDDIKNKILLQRLQQRYVDSKVIITNQEIDNYLFNFKKQGTVSSSYHAAMILISIAEGSTASEMKKSKQKIDSIYQQLNQGADFSELAIEFSQANNALEGGDLGWRKESELPTSLSRIIPKLTPGEYSKPIKIEIGYVIVKLIEKKSNVQHEIVESKAQHILIKPDVTVSAAQARIRLEQLRNRILGGEDFDKLAKSHSDDKGSASGGGHLGWFKPGKMVPAFDKKVQEMSIGEVSEIIETPFGYHIIKLLDRRTRDDSEEYLRTRIREELRLKKIEDEKLIWLRRIKDEAHIDIRLDE